MKKIEKLTPEQEIRFKEFRQQWFKIGTSTEPADRPRAEKAITELYKLLKKKKPKFVWCDSPMQAEIIINQDRDPDILDKVKRGEAKLEFNGTWFWGAQESYWIAFYLFCAEIGVKYKKQDDKTLNLWAEISQSCTWFYPFENVCLICERPTQIHMNDKERLHKDGGPSVLFKDGLAVYSLNDIRVPQYIAETPAVQLDVMKVMAETNVDVRREGLRKISMSKIIKDTKAKKLDEWHSTTQLTKEEDQFIDNHFNVVTFRQHFQKWCNYELYDMDFGDGKTRRVLKMTNPSVAGAEHFERVEDNCETVKQALAWRNSQQDYLNPKPEFYLREVLT